MPETFLALPLEEQEQILRIHADKLGMEANIVEKDIWVCWALEQLFQMPDRPEMAFKGGTSLSKVFKVIDRFSEDIDVSIDYRTFVPEVKTASRSQLSKLNDTIKSKVLNFSQKKIKPYFEHCLNEQFKAKGYGVDLDSSGEKLNINYPSAVQRDGEKYIQDNVLLEFGGRNITEPNEPHRVTPYLKDVLSDFTLPQPEVAVLALMRTYWEKVTLIHVACNRPEMKNAERMSRHWYDLFQLSSKQERYETPDAIKLLQEVVQHKNMFFYTGWSNYQACLEGGLRLLPEPELQKALKDDLVKMLNSGMFYKAPPDFDQITSRLSELQERLNKTIPTVFQKI